MSTRSRFLFAGLLVVVLAGTAYAVWDRAEEPEGTEPLVHIDGEVAITDGRFTQSYLQVLLGTGRNDSPEQRWAHLDRLIRDRLLAREARRRGLDTLAEYADLTERMRLQAAGDRWFEKSFAETLPELTELEVREAYRRSQERVALRQLYFRDPRLAAEAYGMLEAGEDFIELAQVVYDMPEGDSTAGYLGLASYWDLDAAVGEAAYSTPVGSYTPPIRSRYGWHIVRVEDRLRQPFLSEDEFQTRREGVLGRATIRRNVIEGDAFVRELMQSLDVLVNEDAARQLVEVVQGVIPENTDMPKLELEDREIELVREELAPDTPLVSFTLDGEERVFTMAQFVRWLPELPYDEVRDRPVAAVGRALRNEVLGLKGLAEGLERSEQARESIQHAQATFLADTLKGVLRAGPGVEPSDEMIEEAFLRLGYRRIEEARADYWLIESRSPDEAQEILRQVRGGASPESFEGYIAQTGGAIRQGNLAGYLRRLPLDTPTMVCLEGPTCIVAHVQNRSVRYTTLEERRDDIRDLLSRLLPEEQLGDSLLQAHRVRVDSTLFITMMDV